ncbi:hypothetical protein [Chryseobacterium sp. SC28]|uniref:hypothetical protein n=1 Tax=Chryseobacterium sp. SC28 TaxID=2268028 RepID=UPI000F647E29|nr:hypothetical protein [Chryseobacterium sp. SC28]RRQ45702.1 hypothetical protein DTW91_08750 [Chryseobacterium sp. SC28]
MTKNILCNIGEEITLNIGGKFQVVTEADLLNRVNQIYRIQFSEAPQKKHLELVINILKSNSKMDLRFYGNYSENSIDWKSLNFVENLQIDLWETNNLEEIKDLHNLKKLGISKNVKSTVSLKILENLNKLEILYTSISKDVDKVGSLQSLKFLTLREIKTKNLDFLSKLKNLTDIWLTLGSYEDINGITQVENLRKLSIHQIRNFDNEELNSIISNCKHLTALELQNLKNLSQINFVNKLNNLSYLYLDANKNIETFKDINNSKSLKTLVTSNSRPLDKVLIYLENVENVFLGDSYPKSEIEKFSKDFKGKNLWIHGKEIIGKHEYENPFLK